jgi:FixJ family two-component response regulator
MGHAKLVFIVDDDQSVRASLRSLVRSLGCDAETFGSSEALLSLGEHLILLADCVICDVDLPGISGIELQNVLHKRGYLLDFIFLTAYGADDVCEVALSGGALCVLEKPVDPEALCQWIVSAFEFPR